jgi:exopolysaccharide/PEP-CTERM locus tyrosine autokinase
MGKIFDALEKADSTHKSGRRIKNKRSWDYLQTQNEKIVPLPDLNQNSHERELDNSLVSFHYPQSVEAELFRVFRTNLLFPSDGKTPKTILTTSPLPGDGKSFTCANLAVSIAQGVEEHVLLMDCDVRKPTIHTIFGFKQGIGLSDHLAFGTDIAKTLLKTPVDKLTILPAGKPPNNPSELLSSKKMKKLLDEVKTRYEDRYIIIDSPPPSMAPETNAIVKYVDGVIIVVRAGKTPRSAVTETIEQIGKDKILGIVLNQADQNVKKYYGYGKSYYAEDKKPLASKK